MAAPSKVTVRAVSLIMRVQVLYVSSANPPGWMLA
jgi:hypothetical protein